VAANAANPAGDGQFPLLDIKLQHGHCTTECTNAVHEVLCIISGCPAGARKGHISYFAMFLHSKNPPSAVPNAEGGSFC